MRSIGSNTQLALGYENTWGNSPGAGYHLMKYNKCALGSVRNLEKAALLGTGQGRDSEVVMIGATTNEGAIEIPIDGSDIGHWLKLLLGDSVDTDVSAATGSITFSSNPAPNSTIKLNGVTWTFVSEPAPGNETTLGSGLSPGTLASTLSQLATDLNASTIAAIACAQYSATTTTLKITYGSLGSSGNAYTLSASTASNGTVSDTTLEGGTTKHVFTSGAASLPSVTLEIGHLSIPSYATNNGVVANTFAMTIDPKTSRPVATLNLIGQDESWASTSAVGTPSNYPPSDISNFNAALTSNGNSFGNVLSAAFTLNNNYVSDRTVGGGSAISSIDPGNFEASGTLKIRFMSPDLMNTAITGTSLALAFTWTGKKFSLTVSFPEVLLSKPKAQIDGPAGISCDYSWIAWSTTQPAVTFTLINGIENY